MNCRFILVDVAPPPFLAGPPPVSSVLLEDLAKRAGISHERHQVSGRRELHGVFVSLASDANPVVVVVSGHGRTFRTLNHTEPKSVIFGADTDTENKISSSTDPNELIAILRKGAFAPRLVIFDACDLDLRDHRDDGPPVAVLLANPNGTAEGIGGEGLLGRSFARQLQRGLDLDQPLHVVAESTIEEVRRETNGRQEARFLGFGDAGPWRRPARIIFGVRAPPSSASPDRVRRAVLALLLDTIACRGSVSGEVLESAPSPTVEYGTLDSLDLELLIAAQAWHVQERAEFRVLERALEEAGRRRLHSRSVATGLHLLGWALDKAHQNSYAAPFHLDRALTMAEELGEWSLAGRILDTLGTCQRRRGEFNSALLTYHRAFGLKLTDPTGCEITRQNIGWCQALMGDFREASETFGEGVNKCIERLSRIEQHRLTGPVPILGSLFFHLIGWSVSSMILGKRRTEFISLKSTVRDALKFSKILEPWFVSLNHLSLAERVLAVGVGDQKPVDTSAIDAHAPDRWWALVQKCVLEGRGAVPPLLKLAGQPGLGDWEILSYIAGLHHLIEARSLEELRPIRDQMLERLRVEGRCAGIPRPESPPWLGRRALKDLRIDTSFWPEWGPLASQKRAAAEPDVLIEPALTEKFIHTLCWCTLLLVAADGGLATDKFNERMRQLAGEEQKVHFTFGTVLRIADALIRASRPSSDWAKNIKRAWEEGDIWRAGGFNTLDEVWKERNANAHYLMLTFAQAEEALERHQKVIAVLAGLWRQADNPKVSSRADERFRQEGLALLTITTAAGSFECGPLLMGHRLNDAIFYIPQEADAVVLMGGRGMLRLAPYGERRGIQSGDIIRVKW